MRILHVTRENESDRSYGIGRSLAPVLEHLEQKGHHVRYLYQQDLGMSAQKWQRRAHKFFSPLTKFIYGDAGSILLHVWLERLNMGRLAARVAFSEKYDCVHLHDPWLGWGYWIARWIYGGRKTHWGITQHGFGSYTRATQEEGVTYTNYLLTWHHSLEKWIVSLAKFVVSPTDAARQQLSRDLQNSSIPSHWKVVSHARPKFTLLDRQTARTKLGWSENDFHIIGIGRIATVKRFELFIESCIQANREMNITILGAGNVDQLHQKVKPHTQIQLTTLTTSDVSVYLCAADMYMSTSLNESFGLANVEATACGCPAVCSAVGGVAEAVGGGAWLMPGNEKNLSYAIQKIHDHPHLRQFWSDTGKQCAAMLPSQSEVAGLYETIYSTKK